MPGPAEASTSTAHMRTAHSARSPLEEEGTEDVMSKMDDGSKDDADEDDTFDPFSIDPAYRLRTTRTAHSVIAESIRSEAAAEGRKKRRLFSSMRRKGTVGSSKFRFKGGSQRTRSSTMTTVTGSDFGSSAVPGSPELTPLPVLSSQPQSPITPTTPLAPSPPTAGAKEKKDFFKRWFTPAPRPLTRRTVFVNLPLPSDMLKNGEPTTRYVRNKVRTSKYTLITFLPKNLFEQFRRVANIYFLALVILQLFSIFGAPNAQIGMLPLLFILGMTAIKDGIEDWRRAKLDNEVNNSATTKLGGWRNTNQPTDPRAWYEKLFGLGSAPGKTTKGIRKLRAAEANAGKQIVIDQAKGLEEELEAVDKSTVPEIAVSAPTPGPESLDFDYVRRNRMSVTPSIPSTTMSKRSHGVLDWNQPGSGNAQWERTLWKKLEVGDMVLLRENEQVPADIIVLSTSNADNLCFVETKNLDGETNLKVRKPLKATSRISSEEDLEHAHFYVDSEAPHANLYNYNGVLRYRKADNRSGELETEAITINELLLRGCTMRNTKWIIGLVVFTGADTKIMLNGGDTPSKRSKIEKETNFNVAMNFALLMILCLAVALLHGYYVTKGSSADYYEIGARAAENVYLDSVIIFFSCLIVFQNIVPISLYITIEVVKTIQAFFIFQDVEMYYADYDTPCVPKTWNISDDLGQIEYVFSDKTGTLTQNVMEFKKCSIQGVPFGEGMTEAMLGAAKREGRDVSTTMEEQNEQMEVLKADMLETMKHTISNRYLRDEHLTLIAPELPKRLMDAGDSLRPHIINFFTALAICHTVLSDAPDTSKPTILDYKAESPDEAALVAAARDVGFPFVTRNSSRIDIEVLGKAERWTPLRVLEFNSSRKRMSVIARDPDNRIVLFCKGADSVIYQRLVKDHDEGIKDKTLKDLETFANGGLRTLCIAWRHLSEAEYAEWVQKYDAACAAVSDREEAIERSCETIEHSLTIIGATALEDKLQEGVPDAIAMLHQAGIKLWILTGDKLQTAIEIGYSCNLLTNDMEVMIISADSEAGARAQIEAGLNKIASVLGPPDVNHKKKNRKIKPLANFAVVIDGESLRYALSPALKPLFLTLGTQCAAVICCRVSPSQKALTVRLVKDGCNAMTLSIGDGANDVAMIQEANVGVGLFGLEGSQAAMSADYAFGQFRFLTRLLLVHGRWSYVRIADMHANFFYKNVIWTISMFWFQIFNGFDATYLFEYTLLLLYNLVFTSLPVGILGALDQDTNAIASLAFPQLYRRGMMGLDYTRTRFWLYMGDGLYQSAILFFIPMLCYGAGHSWASDGKDTNSLYDIGSTIAVAGVFAANLYVGINTRYWTVITWIVYVGSTLLVYIWIPIYSALAAFPYYGEAEIIYGTFNFWFVVFFTVFCCVGPRWLVVAFRNSYLPRDKDVVREAWVAGDLKRELGLKKRRQIKAEKKARSRQASASDPSSSGPHDSPPTYFDHVHEREVDLNADMDVDMERGQRYGYEPAGTSSPLGERPRSPLLSDAGTPRGPFSYTPSPARGYADALPTTISYQHANAPPPLNLPQRTDTTTTPPYAGTPTSGISYTSPTALETMNLASDEIRRLSHASTELKRSSLSHPVANARPSGGSRKGSRESWADALAPNQAGSGSRRSSPPMAEGKQSYPLAPIVSHEPLGPRQQRDHLDYGGRDEDWGQDERKEQRQRDSTASGYGYAV